MIVVRASWRTYQALVGEIQYENDGSREWPGRDYSSGRNKRRDKKMNGVKMQHLGEIRMKRIMHNCIDTKSPRRIYGWMEIDRLGKSLDRRGKSDEGTKHNGHRNRLLTIYIFFIKYP